MGREVRMVPPDWKHPKDGNGNYRALLPRDCMDGYDDEDEKPGVESFMPEFEEGTATHLRMYEDCSEGTPISPAFATAEELARWLADNKASAFGHMTATYEQWLAMIEGDGYAVSMVTRGGQVMSGVEAGA